MLQKTEIFIFFCDPLQKCSKKLCFPNKDFGRMNKRLVVLFSGTLQRFVAQIKYSHIVDRAGRGRPIAPRPRFVSLAVQASLQLSGWSLR
jgi:hypothetical protein